MLVVEWMEPGEEEARMPGEGGNGRRRLVGQRGGVVGIESLMSVPPPFPKMSPRSSGVCLAVLSGTKMA